MGIHDVNPTLLIERVAVELKKEPALKAPSWAIFVKTGVSRERAPMQADWWHIRAAAILRKLFVYGPVGTSKLCAKFGGRKNRGVKPDAFFVASGNHIRKILQGLEKSGLAKQVAKGVHKGRIATPKGQSLLETTANAIMKEQGIVLPKKSDVKVQESSEPEQSAEKKVSVKKPRVARKKKEEVKQEAAV